MRRVVRAKGWRVLGSLAAGPLLLVLTVAGCGGTNVGISTPTQALPSSASTTTSTSTTSSTSTTVAPSITSTTPSTSTTSSTSTTVVFGVSAVDWADPGAIGRDFFEAWRAGDESRMRLLVSEEEFLDWVFEVRAPDETVECRSIDSETVQCDVTVIATGELYFALLRQDDVSGQWRVDWASVSNVNEGGCC